MSPVKGFFARLPTEMQPTLLVSESEEMALGSDVHQIFNKSRCGGNFFADDVSSQDFQLFRAGVYGDNSARV